MSSDERLRQYVRTSIIERYRGHSLRTILESKGRVILSFDLAYGENGATGEVVITGTEHYLYRVTISQYKGTGAPTRVYFFQPKDLGVEQNSATNLLEHFRLHGGPPLF